MAYLMNISGGASALLLLAALLAAGARADTVTAAECGGGTGGRWGRVRRYPVDSDATWLDMDGCSLTAIQEQSLTGLPAVTWLWLSYNRLRELPVFDHTCHNLTRLALADNQLTSINSGTFAACTKLEILYLNDNQIEFIHHSVFTALTNLKVLNLYNNKIRFIPDQMFYNNGKLEQLHLNGNMLTQLPPEFVSGLKRAAPRLHVFIFYINPWHCACLVELLADVQSAGVQDYGKWGYDGTAPECVYTGAAPCCRRAPTGLRGGGLA